MHTVLVTAIAERAARQDGAVTTHELRRLGLSAKAQRTAVRHGWLTIVEPGVAVVAGSADTWRRRLRVGLLALDGRAWISHDAAAAWYGLAGTTPGPVEFTLPRAARGVRCSARTHTTDDVRPGDVHTIRGLRCSSPARTIIDLAHDGVPPVRLAQLLDDAVRRGLTTRREVTERLTAGSGTPWPLTGVRASADPKGRRRAREASPIRLRRSAEPQQ